MTTTIPIPSLGTRRTTRRQAEAKPHADRVGAGRERDMGHERPVLGRYTDRRGRPREVIIQAGWAESVLVVDRDLATLGDRRLVAHLGADEPAENAALVCGHYLQEARGGACRCRPVTREDFEKAPFPDADAAQYASSVGDDSEPLDGRGRSYRLELLQAGMSIPELRWRRHPPEGAGGEPHPVSVRAAVGCLESYEPIRTLTLSALAMYRGDPRVSTAALRAELKRVRESPIVLNRGLRAAVLESSERQGLSMSEIAIRCGRVKSDCRGNESGETSWLARRLGILPEGGRDAPTPWIHSDVLGLIARRGLGISPREVELG